MRKFHSLRLKLLGVVDGADVELLKVDAENEPKFIWGGAGCWKVMILCGKMSCVAEGIDRKSVEVTGGSTEGIAGAIKRTKNSLVKYINWSPGVTISIKKLYCGYFFLTWYC